MLSPEVTPIVFRMGKGLCAKSTLCSDLVLAVLLTVLTSRHGRDNKSDGQKEVTSTVKLL